MAAIVPAVVVFPAPPDPAPFTADVAAAALPPAVPPSAKSPPYEDEPPLVPAVAPVAPVPTAPTTHVVTAGTHPETTAPPPPPPPTW